MESIQCSPLAFKRPACSFMPALLHPHYEAIKAQCEPWILGLPSTASPVASQFFLDCKFPLFSSLCYATSATPPVVLLTKLMAWFFASDDDDDDPMERGCDTDHVDLRHKLLLACYSGKPLDQQLAAMGAASAKAGAEVSLSNITKGLPALHEVWKDILPHLPPKMLARYLDAMRDHLNANRLQAHYRKEGRLPGLEEYRYALRRPTSLVTPCLILIEYGLGIELDEETIESEAMVRLLEAVVDHIALTNDVLSYDAERSSGDSFNLPCVIFEERVAAQPGFVFAEAVQEALDVQEEVDKLCVQRMKEVRNSKLIEKAGVTAFLRGLELWMAGNLQWSLTTARYSRTSHACSSQDTCNSQGLVLPVCA